MDTKSIKTMFVLTMYIMGMLALVLSSGSVAYAAPPSPFVGSWRAIDVDESDIRLTIAGPPNGPYQITWTESYISFCDGEPGIVRGTGWLNEDDPNLLEADLRVECFTTGESLNIHMVWQYHSTTNTLSSVYGNGFVTIWHRPGRPPEPPPALELRVNYGHDWVESFYEAGHTAWVTVADSDGNVRATTELITEPKGYWDGETGFQTGDSVWFDLEENQLEYPPDIQPYDWVYGWVDNGASAQVQIGDISGMIDFETDSIGGTVNAPWFSSAVEVECFAWGSGDPSLNMWFGPIYPYDDPYSCSWDGSWEIKLGQDVGVGYFGPDGHWVANAFYSYAHINASEEGDWLWTSQFTAGELLTVSIYASNNPGLEPLWQDSMIAGDDGFVILHYEDHELDLVPGNYIVVSDNSAKKGLVLEPISIDVFDTIEDIMAGTAPKDREVLVAAGLADYQEGIWVTADGDTEDPDTGAWFADFGEIGYDITEDMRPWSWVQIFDEDSDANEGITPPQPEIRAWLGNQRIEGYQWPLGARIDLYINDVFIDSQQVQGDANWTFAEFDLNGWMLEPGQDVTMIGGGTEKSHTILPVNITSVDTDLNIVEGTASNEGMIILCVYDGGCEPPTEVFADNSGNWSVLYGEDFVILPGFGMDATEFDDDGDGTSFDYWVP